MCALPGTFGSSAIPEAPFGHHDRGGVATFAEESSVATLGYRILHVRETLAS